MIRYYQDKAEARPDHFIRFRYPKLLDESREAVAKFLNAEVDSCVLVPNATTAVNTVLRSLVFEPGDVIIYPSTTYGAVEKTIEYIKETTPAQSHKIETPYPLSDDHLCSLFEEAIHSIRASGKNARIAVFDTIVSLPGARMPFERLTQLCRSHGVLSCIDGAHSIGQIDIDLRSLDPDFYTSNCHKWLHVPRGCAVFYVPVRNQHLIRSTLPTSHGFLPKGQTAIYNPFSPTDKSEFVNNFEFVGTIDNTSYLCIPAALEWRSMLTWKDERGEKAIRGYCQDLARKAGHVVSEMLGTHVMENEQGNLGNCAMTNVLLPLSWQELAKSDYKTAVQIAQWISDTVAEEYDTFVAVLIHADQWWVRLSAQVYLTIADFEWAGPILKEVCERVQRNEWKTSQKVAVKST